VKLLTREEILEAINVTQSWVEDSKHKVTEKIFCLALMQQPLDTIHSVISDYNYLKKTIGL
jgi:hypothetical protein